MKENSKSITSEEVNKYIAVCDIAAQCTKDLDLNLKAAYVKYMRGEIDRGAYEHTLARHGTLHEALFNAGYTEKHRFFEYPIRPKS